MHGDRDMKQIKYHEFIITYWAKPIPDRAHDYDFVHEDFDGAEDSNDYRCGSGSSVDDCKQKIDELYEHLYSAMN